MSVLDKLGGVGEVIQNAVSTTTAAFRANAGYDESDHASSSLPNDTTAADASATTPLHHDAARDRPSPFLFPTTSHGHSFQAVQETVEKLGYMTVAACSEFAAAATPEAQMAAYGRCDRIVRKALIAQLKPLLGRISKSISDNKSASASALSFPLALLQHDNTQLEDTMTVLARAFKCPALFTSPFFRSHVASVSARLSAYHDATRALLTVALVPTETPTGRQWGETDLASMLLEMRRAFDSVSDVPSTATTVAGRIGNVVSSLLSRSKDKVASAATAAAAASAAAAGAGAAALLDLGGSPGRGRTLFSRSGRGRGGSDAKHSPLSTQEHDDDEDGDDGAAGGAARVSSAQDDLFLDADGNGNGNGAGGDHGGSKGGFFSSRRSDSGPSSQERRAAAAATAARALSPTGPTSATGASAAGGTGAGNDDGDESEDFKEEPARGISGSAYGALGLGNGRNGKAQKAKPTQAAMAGKKGSGGAGVGAGAGDGHMLADLDFDI